MVHSSEKALLAVRVPHSQVDRALSCAAFLTSNLQVEDSQFSPNMFSFGGHLFLRETHMLYSKSWVQSRLCERAHEIASSLQ